MIFTPLLAVMLYQTIYSKPFVFFLFYQKNELTPTPYMEVIESLVNKGHQIPIQLDAMMQLEERLESGKAWLDEASKVFLKKKSPYSLNEVLDK